jgi:hypothetical protein
MSDDLASLLRHAEQSGDDSALDELVYETVQKVGLAALNELPDPADQEFHFADRELQASQINNSGFERQIEYLLRAGVSSQAIEEALCGK